MNKVTNMVMTKVTNRGLPRQELRRRISEAALALWRDRGFDAVSVDEIVARAGVSKGAFFIFFPSKADALADYYVEVDARLAVIRRQMDPARPLMALEDFFARAETLLRDEGDLIRVLMREMWVRPSLRALDDASGVEDRRGFTDFFADAQAAGSIDPDLEPAMAAELVADLWTGSTLGWLAAGQSYSLAEAVRPKLRLVFTGIRP